MVCFDVFNEVFVGLRGLKPSVGLVNSCVLGTREEGFLTALVDAACKVFV